MPGTGQAAEGIIATASWSVAAQCDAKVYGANNEGRTADGTLAA
jgi:hypothetical protein